MAFVGPHHGPKILGKNHQSTTKVTLNEPPIRKRKIAHYGVIAGSQNQLIGRMLESYKLEITIIYRPNTKDPFRPNKSESDQGTS